MSSGVFFTGHFYVYIMANEFVARKGLIVSGSTIITGSVNTVGTITASAFKGDGSELYNLPSSSLTLIIDSEVFIGDGITDTFSLAHTYHTSSIFVSVDGLSLTNDVDYTLTGNALEFVVTPPSQSNILVRAFVNSFNGGIGSYTGSFLGTFESASYALVADGITGPLSMSGDIVPSISNVYNLGSPSLRFKDLYLSGSTLYLGNLVLKESASQFVVLDQNENVLNNTLSISGSDTNGITYDKTFTKIQFDDDTGLHVSESSPGTALISIASHFRDIVVSGSSTLRATGSDALEIIGSGGLQVLTRMVDTNGNGYVKELVLSTANLSASIASQLSSPVNLSTYASTGSNVFRGNQTITGSLSISSDLIVLGSSSIRFISSSLNIGSNRILLNAQGPSSRFGGISVIDSGSGRFSGSLFFDSVNNRWLFEQTSGSIPPSYRSAILIAGPRNTTGSLGDESTLIVRRIPVATSDHNIGNSQIIDDGNNIHISGGLIVTGSISGTFAGTIANATLAQTASLALTASYVAGAETNWGALSGKPEGLVSSSTQVDFNEIQNQPTTVETASYVEFMFIGNKPSLVSSSEQINTGSFNGSFFGTATSASYAVYVDPDGLPEGTVSSSAQAVKWSVETSSWAERALVALTSSVEWLDVKNKPRLISSSLQFTSSVEPFTGSFNGTFFGTASYVISASYAAVISGNIATSDTASYVFPFGLPAGTVSSSTQIDLSDAFSTASHAISSSYSVIASLARTASFATVTPLAVTASYALVTAGYISNADTASYAVQAQTASHATFTELASTSSRLWGGPDINDASLTGSYLPLWQNSTQQTISNIYLRNGNIGISSINPIKKLHVVKSHPDTSSVNDPGSATAIFDADNENYLMFRNSYNNGSYAGIRMRDVGDNAFIVYRNNTLNDPFPYWNLPNNHSLIYGSLRDHVFQVGGGTVNAKTEIVRFKDNGNVGIGVPNPLTTLHVGGTISGSALYINGPVSASLLYATTLFGQATSAISASQSVSASYALTCAGFVENAATASYVFPEALFGAASSSEQVKPLLPEGTVSSSEQIATGSFYGGINSASYAITASYAEMISGTYAMAITSSYALTSSHVDGGATNYIPLWRNRTQMSASWMYEANENIGIRTKTPLARLHVVKSVPQNVGTIPTSSTMVLDGVNDNFLWFRNSRDNNSYAGLVFQDNNLGGYILYRNGITGSSDPDNAVISGSDSMQYGAYFDHVFQNGIQQQLGSRTETMRITVSGSVGIGIQRPTAKLHVDGDVSASSFKGTYTGSFSGSYFGQMAGTASWANNAVNAINATTASYVLPLNQNVDISGSLTVLGLLTAVTMSTQYVTSSQLNISDNKITVQTSDLVRFGGLSVYDSGSTAATASIYWDSQNHNFIYENLSGSGYNSAIFIAGPQNTGPLGNEVGLTIGRIPVAVGNDHIDNRIPSSSIRIDFPSRLTHIEAGLYITGAVTTSVAFNGSLTGSVFGTASWAVSSSQTVSSSFATTASYALNAGGGTGVGFPFSGSAVITGSMLITGSSTGSTVFRVAGVTGDLFSVDDSLTGTLFAVTRADNNPIIEVLSDNTIIFGTGSGDLFYTGSNIGIGKVPSITLNSPKLQVSGGMEITGSLRSVGGITGSVFGTSSWSTNVISSSFALTASYALNAAGGGGAGVGFPFSGSAVITGSMLITGSSTGSTVFRVAGAAGDLFSVDDSLTGTLFAVTRTDNNPIIEVLSDNTIIFGTGSGDLFYTGSYIGIGRIPTISTGSPKLQVSGGMSIAGGSTRITGSLAITGSGSTIFDIYGTAGNLFSVVDGMSGSLMSVNDISGIPIFEVFSDDRVVMGTFNRNTLVVTGSRVGIDKAAPTADLDVSGSVLITGSLGITGGITGSITTASYALNAGGGGGASFPYTGSAIISGSLLVTGSTSVLGQFSATTKSFKIDHRILSGKSLIYGVLEGPEHAVYARGRLINKNTIKLPDEWDWLVDKESITVQLTPVGKHQKLYVKEIVNGIIFIENDNMLNNDVDCFYFVQATRIDVEPLQTVV